MTSSEVAERPRPTEEDGESETSTSPGSLGNASSARLRDLIYMMLIVTPIALFAGIVTAFGEVLGAFGRVQEVLALPTESRGSPVEEENSTGQEAPVGVKPEVANTFEFEGVGFRYDGTEGDDWALRDIDLAIPARSVTAVVGPSGAGKSTLFGLMERFYDPVEGTIRFLGEDVRFLGRDSVRTHLA